MVYCPSWELIVSGQLLGNAKSAVRLSTRGELIAQLGFAPASVPRMDDRASGQIAHVNNAAQCTERGPITNDLDTVHGRAISQLVERRLMLMAMSLSTTRTSQRDQADKFSNTAWSCNKRLDAHYTTMKRSITSMATKPTTVCQIFSCEKVTTAKALSIDVPTAARSTSYLRVSNLTVTSGG